MFRSAENLRLAADMRALQRVAAPWRKARSTWFDGTPESIEGRLAATERVLTYARGGVTQAHMALEREASIARAELKEASHRLMVDFLDDGARAFKGSRRVAGMHDADPSAPWRNTMDDEPYSSLSETPDFEDLSLDGSYSGKHRSEDYLDHGMDDEHICDHCGLISPPEDVEEEGRCPDCSKATDDPHDPLPDYMQPGYRSPYRENNHGHWEDDLMEGGGPGAPQDGPGRHRSEAARRWYAEDSTTAPTTPLVPQTGTQLAQPATGSLPGMQKSQPATGNMGTQKVNPGTSFAPEPSPSGGSDPDAFKADPVGPRDIPAINTDIEINSADGIGYWSNGMPKEPVRSGWGGLYDKMMGQPNQPSNFDHGHSGLGGGNERPGYKEGPGYQPGEAYYPNTMPTASRRRAAPMASPGDGGSAIAPVEMGGGASASIPGAIGKMIWNGSTMTGQEPPAAFNAGPGVTPKMGYRSAAYDMVECSRCGKEIPDDGNQVVDTSTPGSYTHDKKGGTLEDFCPDCMPKKYKRRKSFDPPSVGGRNAAFLPDFDDSLLFGD